MRGRPVKSTIRQNMIELLFHLGSSHGYEIFRKYMEIFPKATQRVIYYHLKKGKDTEEFAIDRIVKEEGDYSWGSYAEKVYYKLGPRAVVKGSKIVEEFMKKELAKEKANKKNTTANTKQIKKKN